MNWTAQFDGYCERVDLTYWSEPVNAVTNAAFLIAAVWMWRRYDAAGARLLSGILFIIGIGSYLFHTHATAWAALADVTPIGLYILTYLFLVNRDALGLSWFWAALATALYIPYAAILLPILSSIPFIGISNFYWTVPILLVVYGIAVRHSQPAITRGFMIGAALLSASITIRSVDEILCNAFPLGTHFGWHILNGVMLGYMIHVYGTHILAARRADS